MILFCLIAAVGLVADGDSLTATNVGAGFPGWPNDTTNFAWVVNKAISGGALLDYPTCPHVILSGYPTNDQPFSPQFTQTNAFFVCNGALNDLVFGRHTPEAVFEGYTNLWLQARRDGLIVVGCTLAPSSMLSNDVRLAFNSLVISASNSWDVLMDWASILPSDYSVNTNYSIDGTHPTSLSAHILAGAMDGISQTFPLAKLSWSGNVLRWPGYFALMEATNAAGPYIDTGARIAPFTNGLPGNNFYTLRP